MKTIYGDIIATRLKDRKLIVQMNSGVLRTYYNVHDQDGECEEMGWNTIEEASNQKRAPFKPRRPNLNPPTDYFSFSNL